MNERYLYRGKRKDNGEWVTGYLIQGNNTYIVTLEAIYYMVVSISYMASVEFVEVLPETVGQCTGLKDKNGNWIFEGDIIEYKFEYGKIIYSESEAMYIAEFDTWCTDFDHIDSNRIEVIDNIHDNPELLEVE